MKDFLPTKTKQNPHLDTHTLPIYNLPVFFFQQNSYKDLSLLIASDPFLPIYP